MARPLLAALLSASLVAGASLPPSSARAAEEDAVAVARELYDRGTAKFETADYEGAIELWTDAYARLPTSPETIDIKILILYNLATAREKAYEVDGELSHLRQALVLLDGFEKSIPSIYEEGEAADAEAARVAERKAAIKAQLDAAEAKQAAASKDPKEPRDPKEPTTPPPSRPPGRSQVILGATFIGVGVAGLGVMTTGLVLGSQANDLSSLDPGDIGGRRDQFDRGRLGNSLAVVGVVLGATMVATGAVFLGFGAAKNRKHGKGRGVEAGPSAAAAPFVAPGLAGVGVTGRF